MGGAFWGGLFSGLWLLHDDNQRIKYETFEVFLFLFFSVLCVLREGGHLSLFSPFCWDTVAPHYRVCLRSMAGWCDICVRCEMTRVSLVDIHRLTQINKRENCFFLVMRTSRVYSLSNFQIYHTAVITIVIMSYNNYLFYNLKVVPLNRRKLT